ncbi:hypothetical protein ES708_18562 [subsurface metagenome]
MSARKFKYRGFTLDELKQKSMDEILELLPSRRRRSLSRQEFWTTRRKKLLEDIRVSVESIEKGEQIAVRTHIRDMPILPEMVGATVGIYNGKDFITVEISTKKRATKIGMGKPGNF